VNYKLTTRQPWDIFVGCSSKIAKSDYWLRHVCLSTRPSTWNKSASTEGIVIKFISY